VADIFVSYSQADRDRVLPIVDALRAQGFSLWWDPEGAAGEDLDDMVHREIRAATCVLVAWSATSVESDWVKGEAEEARKQKKLIPVGIDGTDPPIRFGHGVRPDLSAWGGSVADPEFQKLLKGIHGFVRPQSTDEGRPEPAVRVKTTRWPLLWVGAAALLVVVIVALTMRPDEESPTVVAAPPPVVVNPQPSMPSHVLSISEIHLEDCQGSAPVGGRDEICLALVRNDVVGSKRKILGCDGEGYQCGRPGIRDVHVVNGEIGLEVGKNSIVIYEEDPQWGVCLTRGPVDADNRCVEMGRLEFTVDDGGVRLVPGSFELWSEGARIDPVDIEVDVGRLYEVHFDEANSGRYRIFWNVASSDN
jgi:hypothetical protein